MRGGKKEVPDYLERFEHQHSGGVIPLDRSKTMTKYRSLLAKSMNASREHSTPLYVRLHLQENIALEVLGLTPETRGRTPSSFPACKRSSRQYSGGACVSR